MTRDTYHVLCDPSLVEARKSHFERMRSVFDLQPQEKTFVLSGIVGQSDDVSPCDAPKKWVGGALEDLARQAERLIDDSVFRPVRAGAGPYGVHFAGRMFGARVFELSPDNRQCHPLEAPIGSLEPVGLESHETWALERRGRES